MILRVGNASGFYGDRFSAVNEMLTGGRIDVLTGDYLAELTMLILGRDRIKDPSLGYARSFVRQMKENLALAVSEGVKIVSNAGGLNPAGLAKVLDELGTGAKVSYVDGDDLSERFPNQLTANAYLGGWGIADCLSAGADIVVTGRVTDSSLTLGPAAAFHGWARDDFDALAGATVAGHILECGAQATGGNYSFFQELDTSAPLGFPLAEISADGSSVITKHPGTGGAVSAGTVTAQLLYEIGSPLYLGPDVISDFSSLVLTYDGPDRVRVSGARGLPPSGQLKVCLNRMGGFRNQVDFVLTGLDLPAKEAWLRSQLAGLPAASVEWIRHGDLLRCVVKDPNPAVIGRAFSGAAIELALASYPGFHVTAPPGDATPYGVYTAAYVDADTVAHTAVLHTGTRLLVPPTPPASAGAPSAQPSSSLVSAGSSLAPRVSPAQSSSLDGVGSSAADRSAASEIAANGSGADRSAAGASPVSGNAASESAADGSPAGGSPAGRSAAVLGAAGVEPASDSMAAEAGPARVYGEFPPPTTESASAYEERAATAPGGAAVMEPGSERPVGARADPVPDSVAMVEVGATRWAALGAVVGARSGDKGGDANIGVWAKSDEAYAWLAATLTVEKLRELLPEVTRADRFELPNLRALNFVCYGLLGEGVSSSTRFDPQAKSLGEQLRATELDIPEVFL
jgi:hypothetical protein